MISKKLLKYLDEAKVKYEIREHKKVYTAHDAAATMRVELGQIAKSLIVKFNKPFIDNYKPYALAIVGADRNVDLKKLARVVSAWAVEKNKELRLAKPEKSKKIQLDCYNKVAKAAIPKENDLKNKLKINPGTTSAFGSLYKIPVFVDKLFLGQAKATFSSGDFTSSIEMGVKDFAKLEEAMDGNFSVAKKIKKNVVKAKPKKKSSAEKKVIEKKQVAAKKSVVKSKKR